MSDLKDDVKGFANELKSLNILVLGLTGVGKSSIINAIFGEGTATVGAGKPQTPTFENYTLEVEQGIPLSIYDSAGCEVNNGQSFVDETRKFLEEKRESDKDQQIHIAWYVVNSSSARFQPFESEIIKSIHDNGIPLIIVLSQCDRAEEEEISGVISAIESDIKKDGLKKVYEILKISANPLKRLKIQPFGLEELIHKTHSFLPKITADLFIAAQILDVKAKREIAKQYIIASAGGCFAAGFIPFPFTTAAAALTAQTALWNQIAALYRLDKIKGLSEVWKKITLSPKAIMSFTVTSVADFFTWTGVGAAVAGSTAATFITIVGLSLMETFEELAIKKVDGISKREIEDLLQKLFEKNYNKYIAVPILVRYRSYLFEAEGRGQEAEVRCTS
ncbi:GTPase domain-containing protein [Crocosphaera sp. Alani8]|uniref:GTPase domain-containing protein n=1 Tax=Crocosphaera sp. Alani8 TaxID=3038952 RepID=UPI00313A891A